MRRLPVPARIAVVALGLVLAINVAFAVLGTLTGGGRPGGPSSSSYATGHDGLAAYASLLADHGHPVERLRVPLDRAGLRPEETVVLADPGALSDDEVTALAGFVQGGGRLVTTGIGGARVLRALSTHPAVWSSRGSRRAGVVVPVDEVAGVTVVRGSGVGAWRDPGDALPVVGSGELVVMVVASVEAGRVVALADPGVLQNRLLAQADNAALGVGVAGERGRPVRFAEAAHGYGREDDAGALDALPDSWFRAVGALFTAVLLWMWSRGARLGPPDRVARDLPPPRRQYVDAMAAALARTGDPDPALVPDPEERRW